jgi:ATP-binding cassette subfamily C (CFTR/MRP) protein 1
VTGIDLSASIVLLPLIYLGDDRQIRPSTSIVLYLLSSALVLILSLWTRTRNDVLDSHFAVYTFLIAVQLALLILENASKEKYFAQKYQSVPHDDYKGIIDRTFFWWLKDLFVTATTRRLNEKDFFPLSEDLKSTALGSRISESWNKRSKTSSSTWIC